MYINLFLYLSLSSTCILSLTLFTGSDIKRRIKCPCYVTLIILGNAPCAATISRTKPKAKYSYVSGGHRTIPWQWTCPAWFMSRLTDLRQCFRARNSKIHSVDIWRGRYVRANCIVNVSNDCDLLVLSMTHQETNKSQQRNLLHKYKYFCCKFLVRLFPWITYTCMINLYDKIDILGLLLQ